MSTDLLKLVRFWLFSVQTFFTKQNLYNFSQGEGDSEPASESHHESGKRLQPRRHAAIARTNSRLTDNKVFWQGAIFKVGDDVRQVEIQFYIIPCLVCLYIVFYDMYIVCV